MAGATPRGIHVRVENLRKDYGQIAAVEDVSFSIKEGEFVALLGPSGCGKTTTLRCIAGLETPTGGTVTIGNEVVSDVARGVEVPTERRDLGFVFQSYAIWPHMTVEQNVSFPLRMRKWKPEDIRRRVKEILELVDLPGYEKRPATQLSGGQQQRVALARALASKPRLILFDEPLSNLDAKLRERMRFELKHLHSLLGFTAVYVTHDRREALSLADQVIIMNKGRIEQMGTAVEVSKRPRTRFVADFIGFTNALKGQLTHRSNGVARVTVPGMGEIVCEAPAEDNRLGDDVVVVFRPDAVSCHREPGGDGANWWKAVLRQHVFSGDAWEYQLETGGGIIQGMSPRRAVDAGEGQEVWMHIAPEDCRVVSDS